MKKVSIFILYLTLILETCLHGSDSVYSYWKDSRSQGIIREVVSHLPDVSLPDGKSIFDTSVKRPSYKQKKLVSNVMAATQAINRLVGIFSNPVKSKGWLRTTYYTPAEIFDAFNRVATLACNFDPTALYFFKILFQDGKMLTTPIPGLTLQTERAKLFHEMYDLRLSSHPGAATALEKIMSDIEKSRHTYEFDTSSGDEDGVSDTSSTLRRRRTSSTDVEETSDSEGSPLLHSKKED